MSRPPGPGQLPWHARECDLKLAQGSSIRSAARVVLVNLGEDALRRGRDGARQEGIADVLPPAVELFERAVGRV